MVTDPCMIADLNFPGIGHPHGWANDDSLADLRAEVLKVRNLDPHKSNPPVLMGLPLAYLIDLKGYDPLTAKNLKIPMLFLQGERDFQVTMQDFNLWKSAMAGRRDSSSAPG